MKQNTNQQQFSSTDNRLTKTRTILLINKTNVVISLTSVLYFDAHMSGEPTAQRIVWNKFR